MKKLISTISTLLLLIICSLQASAGSNVMKIHDVIADPDDIITVELEIINDDPFNAFQLDIPLPSGFSFVAGSAQLNPGRIQNHILMTNVTASGALRLIAFHMNNADFLGNDGVVATFQLQTPNAPGIHTLNITNATISGEGGNILTGIIPGTVTLTGDLPQATLTMTFNGSGGATVNGSPYTEPVTVDLGSTLTVEALADTGWEFDSWSGDLSGDASPTTILMDGDKNVTANFSELEPTQYTLSITINGSGIVMVNDSEYTDPLLFDEGTTVSLTASPDEGYQFDQWGGDASGSNPQLQLVMDGNKNISANFSEIPEGDNIMQINDAEEEAGQVIELDLEIVNDDEFVGFQTDIFLPEGFTFVEGSASLNPNRAVDHILDATIMPDGALRLISASFLNNSFLGNDGPVAYFSFTTPPDPGIYPVQLTDPVISDVEGANIITGALDGDITLTEPPIVIYTLTASAGPNGTIQPEGLVEVEEGEDQTFVITPDDNFHIHEIAVDGTAIDMENNAAWDAATGAYTFEEVQQNHTIHATFAIDTYTLIYIAGENGTLDGETEQVVEHGQNGSSVLAIPNDGYAFTGWDDGVTDNPRTDENVTEDITATALFELVDYTLDVAVVPEDAGSVGVVPDQEFYNIGDEITLTATPIDGYEFQNWRLDGVVIGENNVLVFQMPADNVNLEAFFVEEDVPLYDITLTANPTEGGTLLGAGSFLAGEMITVTAHEAQGYKFVGWREGNTFVSFNKSYSFEVTKNRNLVANFSLKRHTVSLFAIPESNAGGGVSGGGTFAWGTEITVRARTNKGFTFLGWFEEEDLVSGNMEYSFTVMSDHQLIAHFLGNYHEITIAADPVEGGAVSGGGNYWDGEVVSAGAEPATGYFFLRWMDDEQGQVSLQNPYVFSAKSDRNLTAEFWGPLPGLSAQPLDDGMVLVTASVHPEGAGLVFGDGFNPITGEGSYAEGSEVSLLASPNAGIDFVHWLEGDDIVGTDLTYTFTAIENVDLTAVFDGETYAITVEADPETGGNPTVSNNGEFFYGEFAQLHANVNPGYQFINWTEDDEQVSVLPDYGFTVTDNVDLVANFEALEEFLLTLLVDPEGAGTVSGGGSYEEGAEVIITAAANEGYTFSYWGFGTDVFSEEHQVTFNIEEDLTLVAYFETNEYTLILIANPTEGGDVTGAGVYNFGDLVDVDAIPNEGWEFVNWTDVDGNEVSDQPDNTIPMPSSDLTLTANFAMIDYTLTLIANPTEGGDVTGAGTYNFGDLVDVDAIPNEGWEFVNWTDVDGNEVSDQPANTIPMPAADLTLTANFAMIDYTLTLIANPTEGGDVTGAGTYNFGDLVDVDAIPAVGWEFINWTDQDGNIVSEDPFNTIAMPSVDVTLIANFGFSPYNLSVQTEGLEYGTALFSWNDGEFRWDEGLVVGQLGFQGNLNSVLGSVHHYEADITHVSWHLNGSATAHETVKVWVLGLDNDGHPDRNNVLYTNDAVSNVDNRWNTYELANAVNAPNGFFIGVSYNGFLGLSMDSGEGDGWEFVPETQFAIFDITDNALDFAGIENWDINQNFLLRAFGTNHGEINFKGSKVTEAHGEAPVYIAETDVSFAGIPYAENADRDFIGFDVYLDNNFVAQVAHPSYLFTGLESGITYQAGVQAVYETGVTEMQTVSFMIPERIHQIRFIIKDETGDPITDAVVSLNGLSNDPGDYFFNVEPGVYNYLVIRQGYLNATGAVEVIDEDVDVTVVMEVETSVFTPDNIDISLYPNPASNQFTVEANTAIEGIRMIDILGKVVYSAQIDSKETFHQIDVSRLDRGLYFVQVSTKHGVFTHRIQVSN